MTVAGDLQARGPWRLYVSSDFMASDPGNRNERRRQKGGQHLPSCSSIREGHLQVSREDASLAHAEAAWGERDEAGGGGTVGRAPPSSHSWSPEEASFFGLRLHIAFHSPVPDTQSRVNIPGAGPGGNSGARPCSWGGRDNQQKNSFPGCFENQVCCSVAITLGPLQVLLYNKNLLSLPQPLPRKDSMSEQARDAESPLKVPLPAFLGGTRTRTRPANFPDSPSQSTLPDNG